MRNSDISPFEHQLLTRLDQISALARSEKGLSKLQTRLPTLPLRGAGQQNATENVSVSEEVEIGQTGEHRVEVDGTEIWLRGSSLLCNCPTCAAPMTIRVWLGLADCWRCETSIALTEEQLDAAANIAQQRARVDQSIVAPQAVEAAASPALDRLSIPSTESHMDAGIRIEADRELDPRQLELERLTRGSTLARLVRGGVQLTPAWLISLLVHLFIILLLAFIYLGDKGGFIERITLSSFLDSKDSEGGKFRLDTNEKDQLQDDLAHASQMAEGDEEIRDILSKAARDAEDLQKDLPSAALPDLSRTMKNITTRPDRLMSFAARDPRVRSEIARKEGGTTLTEAAVARALRWLTSVQNKDGSWSLADYEKHRNPGNKGDVMGTSLALLPLLGAGQTHEYGLYKDNVAAGLAWLIENQTTDGDLRAGIREDAGMYAHGQATIVLCEALAMTGDERFRIPAQRAIQFIEEAQHKDGGWRYQPGQPGDTSVLGWQMMALQSARAPNLNLTVRDETLRLADYFLDTVATPSRARKDRKMPKGSTYAYMKGREATPAMTSEAILCRMYLGWSRDDARVQEGVEWLIEDHLPQMGDPQLYYWYYGTQVMHHYGGKPWKTWNSKMREVLLSTQEKKGKHPGSWQADMCSWGSRGGRIYTTSLACCILEVYYRHLPLFDKIDFDKDP